MVAVSQELLPDAGLLLSGSSCATLTGIGKDGTQECRRDQGAAAPS